MILSYLRLFFCAYQRVLPANEKITKEAKEAVQECVSEFISFITSEASDRCQQEKRKTINGEDLLWAMGTLGFDDYNPPLKNYLSKFRQAAKKPEGASASNAASSGSVVATPKRDNKVCLISLCTDRKSLSRTDGWRLFVLVHGNCISHAYASLLTPFL
jgi:histone H3/H4